MFWWKDWKTDFYSNAIFPSNSRQKCIVASNWRGFAFPRKSFVNDHFLQTFEWLECYINPFSWKKIHIYTKKCITQLLQKLHCWTISQLEKSLQYFYPGMFLSHVFLTFLVLQFKGNNGFNFLFNGNAQKPFLVGRE